MYRSWKTCGINVIVVVIQNLLPIQKILYALDDDDDDDERICRARH